DRAALHRLGSTRYGPRSQIVMRTLARSTALSLLLGCAAAAAVIAPRPTRSQPAAGYSPTVTVGGAVAHPAVYDLEALKRRPSTIVTHHCVREELFTVIDHSYRGVLLWTLIAQSEPIGPAGGALAPTSSFVVATASDGFQAIVAMAEVDPELNGRRVLVA